MANRTSPATLTRSKLATSTVLFCSSPSHLFRNHFITGTLVEKHRPVSHVAIRRRPALHRLVSSIPQEGPMDHTPRDENEIPPNLEGQDWREFRATLVAGGVAQLHQQRSHAERPGFWGHPLALPETGSFLASHPAFFRKDQPYLTQAVIFLTHHDETGSRGFVLNRPLAANLSQMEEQGILHFGSMLLKSTLGNEPVYIGGPHPLGQDAPVAAIFPSSLVFKCGREPLPGVSVAKASDVAALVSGGLINPHAVRLFYGCMTWGPGVLEKEVSDGVWFPASASRNFAIQHCIGLPKPLWKELMECQGPTFKSIARRVYGEPDV